MAIEKVKRVEFVGLSKHREKTLDYLHQLGAMHLSSQESADNKHDLGRAASLEKLSDVAQAVLVLKRFDEILSPYVKKTKYYTKSSSYKQTITDLNRLKQNLSSVEELQSTKKVCIAELERLTKKREILEDIPFDISREFLSTEYSKTLVFKGEYPNLPGTKVIEFGYTLLQLSTDEFEKHKVTLQAKHPLDLSVIEEKISVDGRKDRMLFENAQSRLHEVTAQLAELAALHLGEVHRLQKIFAMYRERYEKTSYMMATEETFVLQGFLPVDVIRRLDPPVPLHIREVEEKGEVPVKLKHGFYVNHFAFITKMFGLPMYAGIDPTIYLSLFIPLFFGFMFSDIGYGMLVVLIAIALLAKATPENKILKDAGVVLATCGVSTIIFGSLFGSFFGNLFGFQPLLFDPFANAQTILITSLAIGIVHINLGLLLAIRKNTIGVLSLWLLQIGGALLALGMGAVSWFVLALSFALFIYKSKMMGLMEITGFVGTWFSYARLLALALATGGIALGINIIGSLLGNIPYVGSLLLVLVLVIGHLFNFALNILGSSIHSVRLHYIEFFSQFYEAGGKPFVAFRTKKIQEEF